MIVSQSLMSWLQPTAPPFRPLVPTVMRFWGDCLCRGEDSCR